MEARGTKHVGGVSLPEDIVFEVLARLPAKTLCRLRCVSKAWRALISDPAFVAAQRSRDADPHLVGVFSGGRHLPEVRVMDMDGNVVKTFEITSSTPELPKMLDPICTAGGLIIDPAAGRAFLAFAKLDYTSRAMAYYTSIFGRATPSGVFKVLRLQSPFLMDDHGGVGHQLVSEVATIMDGRGASAAEPLTWRRKSAPPFVRCLMSEHKAIVNGVIYFLHDLKFDSDDDEDEDDAAPSWNSIATFDFESEEWKAEAINVPALALQTDEEILSVALVELKGTLGLVHKVDVNTYSYTSIWLLVDPDKSVWAKEYMIPMPKNQISPAKPLCALVDGRILLRSSVLFENEKTRPNNTCIGHCQEVILFYDPSTKAFTDFLEMKEGFIYTLVFCTASLLS